ncbi:MAG TPA: hypothetical protein DEP85_00305, partial [Holosporales bacterium]|nr:hypothetical protein [Holosporales bacterium]
SSSSSSSSSDIVKSIEAAPSKLTPTRGEKKKARSGNDQERDDDQEEENLSHEGDIMGQVKSVDPVLGQDPSVDQISTSSSKSTTSRSRSLADELQWFIGKAEEISFLTGEISLGEFNSRDKRQSVEQLQKKLKLSVMDKTSLEEVLKKVLLRLSKEGRNQLLSELLLKVLNRESLSEDFLDKVKKDFGRRKSSLYKALDPHSLALNMRTSIDKGGIALVRFFELEVCPVLKDRNKLSEDAPKVPEDMLLQPDSPDFDET